MCMPLHFLSFMWDMLIILAIFFTFEITVNVCRVLKNQLYTDLCILNDTVQFYKLHFTTDAEFV